MLTSKLMLLRRSSRSIATAHTRAQSRGRALSDLVAKSKAALFVKSEALPSDTPKCKGHDFSNNSNTNNGGLKPTASSSSLDSLMQSMLTTGFQATNLGIAIDQIHQMRNWRLSDVPYDDTGNMIQEVLPGMKELIEFPHLSHPSLASLDVRRRIRARITLAFTSNQISSGQREIIRFLVQHRMVDVLITTAGGIEEDLMKCMHPTYLGDFALKGRDLRRQGINRIGNLLVPNQNYCDFEDWISPIIDQMHDEQDQATQLQWEALVDRANKGETIDLVKEEENRFVWTPSKVIERLGNEIDNPESVLYWAAKNKIPVFSPALTDGSLGDMYHFHSYKRPGMVLDIASDIRRLDDIITRSHATGQIILGGGLAKHHCCNSQLMRDGADFSVYVNTSTEFDGSDTGANPEEAISWGKIAATAKPVKVTGDATFIFPLIVSQTFAKENLEDWEKRVNDTVCWYEDLFLEETNSN